jgi:hypothetical protein
MQEWPQLIGRHGLDWFLCTHALSLKIVEWSVQLIPNLDGAEKIVSRFNLFDTSHSAKQVQDIASRIPIRRAQKMRNLMRVI